MNDAITVLPLLLLMLAIGGFAGVVAGLLGVGGGIVLVPAFYYAFTSLGYPPENLMQICVATSLATIVVTSLRSVQKHHQRGAVDWSILRNWAIPIGLGALIGVVTATGVKSTALMYVFGILGSLVGLYMAFGRADWRLGASLPGGIGRVVTGLVLGCLSVLMGIGGGSFGVPMMTLYGQSIHRAVATAAGFGLIIAVPSVMGFLLSGWGLEKPPLTFGLVNLPAFAVVVAMTMITAPLGVRLSHAMNPKPLKRVFAGFIMLMALNMLRKAAGL